MVAPSTSLATLRPDLASMFEFDLEADRQGFIGYQVLPILDVALAADSFGRFKIEDLLHNPELVRNARGGYSRSDYKFVTDSYATREYGHEEVVDENEARRYRHYFDVEAVTSKRTIDAVLRGAERRCADAVFNLATWTGGALTTAGSVWSTYNTATPKADIMAAKKKVWTVTGIWPNSLALNRIGWMHLINCAEVQDAIASHGAGDKIKQRDITLAQVAAVLDLDFIRVSGSAKNTAAPGLAASISSIWGNGMAMVYREAVTNDILEPCLGRTFHWSEDGSQVGGAIDSYRDETVRGDIIRCRHQVHEKIIYKELGHLLTGLFTT